MKFNTLQTHRTGDINFFSACMAIGISPCFPEPAEVMQNDDGNDYLSFRLKAVSECGQHQTITMDRGWGYAAAFKAENPFHPFTMIMNFVDHSKGARRKDDWIESIATFLSITKDAARKAIADVDTLTFCAPESPLTYLACFVVNRFAAIRWANSCIPKTVISAGKSIVMVDGTMPYKKQLALLKLI
jgi:hypothetical protein